jgi:hypothetical protein
MKPVTIPAVQRLVAAPRDETSVSIYLTTNPEQPGRADDRARLRALLRRTSELLCPRYGRDEIDRLLLPIAERAREDWPAARGLAFLSSRTHSAAFTLPVAVPDLAIVAPSFHTKPLVSFLDGGDRFVLLALEEGEAALYEGSANALERLDRVVPQPGDRDDWLRALDERVRSWLWDSGAPLVLAGAGPVRARYRAASRYPWLLEEGLDCDVHQVHVADLASTAARIVEEHRAEIQTEAATKYLSAHRWGDASEDLHVVAREAVAGRVGFLLHRRGAHVWGRLDPRTGEYVLRRGEVHAGDGDLIDDLCELVLQFGGDVVELAPERMPCSAPVGAVIARQPIRRRKRAVNHIEEATS